MSDWHDFIKVQALSLMDGESMQGVCPKCGRTKSFYITREGGSLKFIDFSVNCGFSGVVGSTGQAAPAECKPIKKPWKGELSKLVDGEVDYLSEKFRIKPEHLTHVRYCEDDGRIYFPQLQSNGTIAGYIARYYPELACGKKQYGGKALWRNVRARDLELYFPTIDILNAVYEQKQVVLVEDYPSALRMWSSKTLPTCALGGTTLYEGHIHTIIELGVDRVILILDADAIVKAVKLKRQIALAFPNTIVIPLTGRDVKDMAPNELDRVCERIR